MFQKSKSHDKALWRVSFFHHLSVSSFNKVIFLLVSVILPVFITLLFSIYRREVILHIYLYLAVFVFIILIFSWIAFLSSLHRGCLSSCAAVDTGRQHSLDQASPHVAALGARREKAVWHCPPLGSSDLGLVAGVLEKKGLLGQKGRRSPSCAWPQATLGALVRILVAGRHWET